MKNNYSPTDLCRAIFFIFVSLHIQNLSAEPLVKSNTQTLDLSFRPPASAKEDEVLKINSASILQLGLNNLASVDQSTLKGSNNAASIEQSEKSIDSRAMIIQAGNLNQAVIAQSGISTVASIYQMGSGNRAFINQH